MISCLLALPDNRLASGSSDNAIRIWDIKSGKTLFILKAHTKKVQSLILLNDGNSLVSTSKDETFRVWDITNGTLIKTLKRHAIHSLALLADGRLVSGSDTSDKENDEDSSNSIRIWD